MHDAECPRCGAPAERYVEYDNSLNGDPRQPFTKFRFKRAAGSGPEPSPAAIEADVEVVLRSMAEQDCESYVCDDGEHDCIPERARRALKRWVDHSAGPLSVEQLGAAAQLCQIYFDIAAAAIGEDAVRQQRDERIARLSGVSPATTEPQ